MASSTFYHKPELALRRAIELQGINQPEAALLLLQDVLGGRRHRTWSLAYENIMITYLNLCLNLHRSREAKDGLHQYRNLSQSQAPGSLEKVIRYLMDQAELKCSRAKASADAEALMASVNNDDEDEDGLGASPQAILLSTMSTDPAKSQRDSTLLLPSLKFLWETYRAILDILRSNSKLEHVYHAAAVGALRFCRQYKRRTEFRRLCDMLRLHLGNLQKYGSVGIADEPTKPNNKVRGWEGWTADGIELHLQTRFAQLETASVLHLYTEGFRTVEDIYNILQISHARRKQNPDVPPPKAKLMAAYYEKLTTLFWVSENYLFHAFAWYKYYTLCKEYNRGMGENMKRIQASAVLLAALCIPSLPNDAKGNGLFQDDGVMQEKMARMATLLGFHTRNPTREALLEEIKSRGILEQVPPYLQQLYHLLEEDSDPLVLVENAKPLLAKLQQEVGATTTGSEDDNDDVEDTTLGRYVAPLRSVLLLKLLLNLSAAYHTVSMDHLKNLAGGLDMTFEQVEKAIVLFTQSKTLAVRIDHRAGCLRFGSADLESDAMRSQLTVLAHKLEAVCQILKPVDKSNLQSIRADRYNHIRATREADHAAILERKAAIEKRKEEAERLAQEKVREEAQKKAEEEAARKAEEEKRIAREQHVREQEKQKKIQREIDNMKKQQLLAAMGHNTDAMTDEQMSQIDTEALQKEHQDKINKKREEAERKTREAAKRLDYLVRAIRIEELPLIKKKYEEKIKADRERYEQEIVEKSKSAKLQWEADLKDKETLTNHNVFDYMAAFETEVMKGREIRHKALCEEAERVAETEAEKAKMDRARKRKEDEKKRIAEEENRRKQEEENRRLEEEKRKREEARREKEAKEEERRQAEMARMQEERERKESQVQQQQQQQKPSRDLDVATSRDGGTGGKYVPPSRRARGGGGGQSGGGSRFDDDRRGGGYGGGRYEGRSGGYGDRDRRDDRRGGGGGGGDRDRRGGYGGGGRDDRDRRDGGGGGGNNRWRR